MPAKTIKKQKHKNTKVFSGFIETSAQPEKVFFGPQLTFSGNMTDARAIHELFNSALTSTLSFALWSCIGIGLYAFSLQAYLTTKFGILFLYRDVNYYNIAIAIGLYAALYHWSRLRQKNIEERAINTLKIAVSNTTESFDVYKAFSHETKHIWITAFRSASAQKRAMTGADVFLVLLKSSSVRHLFNRLGTTGQDVELFLKNYASLAPHEKDDAAISQIPFRAFSESLAIQSSSITPPVLLCGIVALLPENHIIKTIFINLGVTLEDLEIVSSWVQTAKHTHALFSSWKISSEYRHNVLTCCRKFTINVILNTGP